MNPKKLISDYRTNEPLENAINSYSLLGHTVSEELDADPFSSIQEHSLSRQYMLHQAK